MKSNNLEKFIRKNRAEFDLHQPSEEVWDKIEKSLKKEKTLRLKPLFYKVAAILAIVLMTSVLAIRTDFFGLGKEASIMDPEVKELIEAEAFYAWQIHGKITEIRNCYILHPEIKGEVEADLKELESMYNDLKMDLRDNLSNKTVIEAMIENSRNRLKLVDDILEQINC